MLRHIHEKEIRLNGSVLGFSNLNRFIFQHLHDDSPFGYLLSLEDPSIGFVVTSPFEFFKQYEFELPEQDREELKLNSPNEALILGIITVQKPFKASTVNLLAPIIINIVTMEGKQIILPPHLEYSTKVPLFDTSSEGGDDSSCSF